MDITSCHYMSSFVNNANNANHVLTLLRKWNLRCVERRIFALRQRRIFRVWQGRESSLELSLITTCGLSLQVLSIYGFGYPVTLTLFHMLFCSVLAWLLILLGWVESISLNFDTFIRSFPGPDFSSYFAV
jgi:hypothetical protein